MKKKKLSSVLGILLVLVMIAGFLPLENALALERFEFLNPLGIVEPRRDIPLACRDNLIDLVNGVPGTVGRFGVVPEPDVNGIVPREVRIGVSQYVKPLDGEPAHGVAILLANYLEAASANPARTDVAPGLTVRIVFPGNTPVGDYVPLRPPMANWGGFFGPPHGTVPANPLHIPNLGDAWNNRADLVYDAWAERTDAMIFGVGD